MSVVGEGPRSIVVVGLGLVSPLGHGAWPTFSALLAGRTLAKRAGNVASGASAVELAVATGGVSIVRHTRVDPAVELAERAAREAAFAAGVELTGMATYLGTSKGAVGALCRAARWAATGSAEVPGVVRWGGLADVPLAVALGPHGYLAHHLAQRTGVAVRSHAVAACASSLTALHRARLALADEEHGDYALVVTAEAALLPLFVHSYQRLGVLAELTPREYRARPLDTRRSGFVLSEIGAAVLLRRLAAGETPKPGQVELVDTAVASEGYDMVRSNRRMEALRQVARKLFARRTIDVLHPHAPGTVEHDPAELAALGAVLREAGQRTAADVYACKGALGHSLGAAGLTGLVVACLCLRTGQRPGMPWLEKPIDAAGLHVSLQAAAQRCSRAGTHAVFAAGFAGHTAGAVVRRRAGF